MHQRMATVDTTVTDLARRARQTGRLGIDTEFMGEGRYRPLLCLVQVAVGFAGRRAQLGYEALLSELTGVRLRKTASFTRWDARPRSEEQFRYAREDVLHLLELADALQRELAERGRLDWAREECRALEDVSDERDPDTI